MNKIFNLFKNSDKQATIIIYGEIGETFWGDGVSEKEIAKELQEIKDVEEIVVKINSPGGNVYSGIAIYNSLKNHSAKIKVEIDGLCASIATVIAMAGDTIVMNPGTNYMIHDPMTVARGNIKNFESIIKRLEQAKNLILDIYMTKVKIPKDEVIKLMEAETYMNGTEALEKGFITEVLNDEKITNKMSSGYDMAAFMNCMLVKDSKESTKNINIEEVAMNKEELKNKHPELYNEIYNEGKLEGEVKERERIRNLDTISKGVKNFKGAEELINKAKYEEIKSAEKVSMEILATCTQEPIVDNTETSTAPGAQDNFLNKFEDKKIDAQDLSKIENSQPVEKNDVDVNLLKDLDLYNK